MEGSAPIFDRTLSYVFGSLTAVWGFLLLASIGQDALLFANVIDDKVWLFDVDVERSFYTWFSTLVLAASALLLALIAIDKTAAHDRLRFHWAVLAVIFLGLSADEAVGLHELASARLSAELDTSGAFHFAWIIPAGLLCLVGLAAYLPFIAGFPRNLRLMLIASAAGFLLGAIGMEMAAGQILTETDETLQSPAYRIATTIEEALEGGSVILFLLTLCAYRRRQL